MVMLWILLGIICVIGVVYISIRKTKHENENKRLGENSQFPIPPRVRHVLIGLAMLFMGLGAFNANFFYAEPGYIYHVRTIIGQERVIDSVGYNYYFLGRINQWKKAMTVQAVSFSDTSGDESPDSVNAEGEGGAQTSASLPPLSVVMLDQVDSKISATTRFRIPSDRETFLRMAHEYRTPENLLRTALIPAFKETLQATGSLMAAEEYYSGRRTEFNAEFENQMQNGIYLVSRHQITVDDPTAQAKASAAANLGDDQTNFGEATKVRWVVKKKMREDGTYERKSQKFTEYGIAVIEARVTDLIPNSKFVERMQLKQQAAADRAIAQEKRVQEEEQRLLAIAKGEREVAEEQAAAKKVQIKQTTEAETDKSLALIAASKQLEQAEIDKQTAQIQKEKADIDAARIKVLADADKYEREARIAGDNALQQKLDAEISIQQVWADAYSKRQVPTYVFGNDSGQGGAPVGSDSEVKNFMQLMTIDAATRLNYNRGLEFNTSKWFRVKSEVRAPIWGLFFLPLNIFLAFYTSSSLNQKQN